MTNIQERLTQRTNEKVKVEEQLRKIEKDIQLLRDSSQRLTFRLCELNGAITDLADLYKKESIVETAVAK